MDTESTFGAEPPEPGTSLNAPVSAEKVHEEEPRKFESPARAEPTHGGEDALVSTYATQLRNVWRSGSKRDVGKWAAAVSEQLAERLVERLGQIRPAHPPRLAASAAEPVTGKRVRVLRSPRSAGPGTSAPTETERGASLSGPIRARDRDVIIPAGASIDDLMLNARVYVSSVPPDALVDSIRAELPSVLRRLAGTTSRERLVDLVATYLQPFRGTNGRAEMAHVLFGYVLGEDRNSAGVLLTLGIEADQMTSANDPARRLIAVPAYHAQLRDVVSLLDRGGSDAAALRTLRRTASNACHNAAVVIADHREDQRRLSPDAAVVVRHFVETAIALRSLTSTGRATDTSPQDDHAVFAALGLDQLPMPLVAAEMLVEMGRLSSPWKSDDSVYNVALNVASALAVRQIDRPDEATSRYFNAALEATAIGESDARYEIVLYCLGIMSTASGNGDESAQQLLLESRASAQSAANLAIELTTGHRWVEPVAQRVLAALAGAIGRPRYGMPREFLQIRAAVERAGTATSDDAPPTRVSELYESLAAVVVAGGFGSGGDIDEATVAVLRSLESSDESVGGWRRDMVRLAEQATSLDSDDRAALQVLQDMMNERGYGDAEPHAVIMALVGDRENPATEWRRLAYDIRVRESIEDVADALRGFEPG